MTGSDGEAGHGHFHDEGPEKASYVSGRLRKFRCAEMVRGRPAPGEPGGALG